MHIDKEFSDEISLNDAMSWQSAEDKFEKARLNLKYNNKIDSFDDIQTSDTTEIIQNDSEQLDNIKHVCNKIVWSVSNNSGDVFILIRYSMSDKTICSIENIEIDRSYEYLCQYG